MQHRDPAQRRPQEFDLTPNKKPRVPEPSSPTESYKSDEPQDDDMTDRHIISAMLRNVDLTEVFLPARVVEACKRHGLVAGDSFDLRTGYGLANETTQRHVKAQIEKSGAVLVMCSPPCTKFSQLQELNLYLNDEKWRTVGDNTYRLLLGVDERAAAKGEILPLRTSSLCNVVEAPTDAGVHEQSRSGHDCWRHVHVWPCPAQQGSHRLSSSQETHTVDVELVVHPERARDKMRPQP